MTLIENLKINNIKISVKLEVPIDLAYVQQRCTELNVYCRKISNNFLTIRHTYTYIVFKKGCTKDKQHINCTKITHPDEIPNVISNLLYLINQPQVILEHKIDNYSCSAALNKLIDVDHFFMNEINISCTYNPEKFPACVIRAPEIFDNKSLCCLLYKSGKLVLVGAKRWTEVHVFYNWIKKVTCPYTLQGDV